MNLRLLVPVIALLAVADLAFAQTPGLPLLPDVAEPAPTATPDLVLPPDLAAPPAVFAPWLDVRADYLLWWIKNGPTPGPLVTTGSPRDAIPGALGQPGTRVLFSSDGLDYKAHSGGRLTADWWFNPERTLGIEASGFILETHTLHFGQDSDSAGNPVLARPFFNTLTGTESARILTAPGVALGGIDVFSDSRLWSAEANGLVNVWRAPRFRADLLAGFRYLGMDESLRFSQSSTLLAGSRPFYGQTILPPDIISLTDRIETRNEFFGGQIGARGEYRWGRLFINSYEKIALGGNREWANLMGDTQDTNSAGVTQTRPGGLLVLPSNGGLHSRGQFTFVNEVGINTGWQITRNLRASIGYTFLYWNDVARPGGQLDPNIDPRNLGTNPRYNPAAATTQPFFPFDNSRFWAQGINFQLGLRF